jgi:hypothetical protein
MGKVLPVALALVLTGPASAAGKKTILVDLDSPPTMVGLAGQVTESLARSAREQGIPFVSADEVREKLGEKNMQELHKCGNKPLCVQSRLASFFKADRAVVGSLDRDEKNYLLKLWLLDLDQLQVLSDVDRPILIASRRFTHDVNEVVPALLRGEREARGKLEVTCNVKGAGATLDGEPLTLPFTIELKPGKHELKVEKKKYLPVARLVTVEANQTAHEEVRLILMPGEVAEEELPPVATGPKKDEGGGLVIPTSAWIAGGVAVVAGGAGAAFGAIASSTEKKLKDGYDPATDTWAGTRKEALDAKQNAIYANVGFGVAGAAFATAAVLTILSQPGDAKTEIAPVAGPGGGGVIITGHF